MAIRRFRLHRKVWYAAAVPLVLLGIGACGFRLTGGPEWSWFDAIYMAAITLTRVGYGETHQLTFEGRVFAIVFLFGGVFALFYSASETIRAIVSGEFKQVVGRDRMLQTLEEIKDHVIICGLGRMGRLVCQEFEKQDAPYVIIDRDLTLLGDMKFEHGVPMLGDATDDEVLKRAGVERAKTLVTVLPSDSDNLYITLSARVLNPKLLIVARAEDESAEQKLRRVGANQVVAPYVIGGHRVAQAVLRPTVGHILEQATRRNLGGEYLIEEILVQSRSPLVGKNLRDAKFHQDLGVMVITIKRPSGEFLFSPQGDTVIEAGSILVVVGHREQLQVLERRAAEKE